MKNLVIVESPSKTKKLESFLGSDYKVLSSVGHIRDLPKSKLSVDVEDNFKPMYIISPDKEDVARSLTKAAKETETIYLATDPDREGEAIAWHVGYVINGENDLKNEDKNTYMEAQDIKNKNGSHPKVYRVSFNSITKDAVLEAFKNPRKLDMDLVNAQQARRVLDRLVGYKLSPLLWEKIRYGLSAGRVQSVAVRFIVEREREIEKFPKDPYYEIKGMFINDTKEKVNSMLTKVNEKSIYQKEKFDLFTGSYTVSKTIINTKDELDKVKNDIEKALFQVEAVQNKESFGYPSPPFTTSTLQQSASSRLGYSPKRTMQLAQKLYEGGYITYMRTDSVNIVPGAIKEIRKYVKENYSEKYLSKVERHYKSKKQANTQEAHEAIRPTHTDVPNIKGKQNPQMEKLYGLIWARAIASQMAPAVFDNSKIVISSTDQIDKYTFEASGSVVKFDGYLKVYSNKKKDEMLPVLREKENLNLKELNVIDNNLTPPARYNEASLVKELEKFGIGRPSTYASIISTIQERGYVKNEDKVLYPTDNGLIVNDLLVNHFTNIVDIAFTAEMEEDLDLIAEGQLKWTKIIGDFYGPFDDQIKIKKQELKKEDLVNMEETDEVCPLCKEGKLIVKLGKYGKFLSCNRYPECKYARPLDNGGTGSQDMEEAINDLPEEYKTLLSTPCPNDQGKLVMKKGRFGTFIACENYPKCKFTKAINAKINMKCPKCGETEGGDVVMKRTKKGRSFYGCSRYPNCDYASWTKPGAEAAKGKKVSAKRKKTSTKKKK